MTSVLVGWIACSSQVPQRTHLLEPTECVLDKLRLSVDDETEELSVVTFMHLVVPIVVTIAIHSRDNQPACKGESLQESLAARHTPWAERKNIAVSPLTYLALVSRYHGLHTQYQELPGPECAQS